MNPEDIAARVADHAAQDAAFDEAWNELILLLTEELCPKDKARIQAGACVVRRVLDDVHVIARTLDAFEFYGIGTYER